MHLHIEIIEWLGFSTIDNFNNKWPFPIPSNFARNGWYGPSPTKSGKDPQRFRFTQPWVEVKLIVGSCWVCHSTRIMIIYMGLDGQDHPPKCFFLCFSSGFTIPKYRKTRSNMWELIGSFSRFFAMVPLLMALTFHRTTVYVFFFSNWMVEQQL